MTPPTNENLTTDADENSTQISYERRGFRNAASHGGNLTQYKDISFSKICSEHTTISDKDRQKKIETIETKISHETQNLESKKQEIQKKESEKGKLQEELAGANIQPNGAPLFISGSIVIILGLALFLFYGLTLSGVIGTLVKSTTDQLQNGQIQATIPTLWDNFLTLPLYLKIISVLLAVLPLGIGYLLHDYKHRKEWTSFYAILSFVFILDVVIAFVVEKQIYNQEGLITELPPFKEYITESILGSFGAIILLGFGAYFVWGLLLDSFLERLSPEIQKSKIEQKIASLDFKIANFKNEMAGISSKINEMNVEIKKMTDSKIIILDREARQALEKDLSEYTSGWAKYLKEHHDKGTANGYIEKLHSLKDEVLKDFYATFEAIKN